MEAIKDVGQIVISTDDERFWKIPNFYDLPQEYNTVIRSPRFHCNDRDWYMEVYPDGRRLFSSSGWFGISILNLNADSNLRTVTLGIRGDTKEKNVILTAEESNGDGFYCCTRFLPRLLLKSWKDIFTDGGDLYLLFSTHSVDMTEDALMIQLITEDVQRWFKEKFEISSNEPSSQVKAENEFPLETDVGEISFDSDDDAEWTIPNFSDLPEDYDTVIRSPSFRFKDRDWYMEVYPNGRKLYSSLGWFGIGIRNLNCDYDSSLLNVRIHIFGEYLYTNQLYFEDSAIFCDSYGNGSYCCTRLFPTSLLKSWKYVVAANSTFSLVFDMKNEDDEDSGNELLMYVEKKSVQKWYKEIFENKDTFNEASTQTEEKIGVEKLRQDFQEMLRTGNISDVVLKVDGQEFRAHKFILAARSPVFLAMMTHDTKEKIDGVVDIPDVDPNIFPEFLNYLYTGRVDNLTSENTAKLYTIADKYQVNELKESCKYLMLMNISIENFCDIFTLSLRHDEKELKEACIQFFAENSLDIVLTCKWQTFLCENPITGNELFIKHLKLNK